MINLDNPIYRFSDEEDFSDYWENLLSDLANEYSVSTRNICDAIFIIYNEQFEWSGDYYNFKIPKTELIENLNLIDFSVFENPIILKDELIESDLKFKTKVKIKQKGEIWIIHKNDKDQKPSNPHAHNLESLTDERREV